MPVRRFQLLAFEDIMLLRAGFLEEGSLSWLLCRYQDLLFPRLLVVFEHWARLCLGQGVVGEKSLPIIDSTPMWCYGAVLGTVNLLGEGLRSLAKRWARARGVPLAQVATEWNAPLLLAKSTKGHFSDTDWSDASARSGVLEQLAELVTRCVGLVKGRLDSVRTNKRLPLARRCRNLLRVVDEDLETADDGTLKSDAVGSTGQERHQVRWPGQGRLRHRLRQHGGDLSRRSRDRRLEASEAARRSDASVLLVEGLRV